MKKTTTTILGILIAIFSVQFAYSQKTFEGSITFDIEYGTLPDVPGIENMLPSEMTVYMKDKKSRIEQIMGDSGGKNEVVYDHENSMAFVAMDMMGQKMLINIDEESFRENIEKSKNAEVEYFEEYREILGYKCQKAVIQSSGNAITVFFTEKIPNYMNQELMNLKGMPIQYEISQIGIEMKMTATKIDRSYVPENSFVKPEGYHEMDVNDFKNMTGQDFKF